MTKRMMNTEGTATDRQICLEWLERCRSERWSNKPGKKNDLPEEKNTLTIKYSNEVKKKDAEVK